MILETKVQWLDGGVSLGALGKHKEALRAFESALKIDPKYDKALRNKGLSFIQLKRYGQAIVAFNQDLDLNPEDGRARYYKGIVYAKMGDNQRAVYLLRRF